MNIDEYQAKLIELWGTPPDCDHLLFCAVGMAEEAGEAMGKVKRSMRGEGFDREGYLLELGDCLAYLTMAAHEKGWTLEEVLRQDQQMIYQIIPNTIQLFKDAAAFLQEVSEIEEGDDDEWLKELLSDVLWNLIDCANGLNVDSSLEEVMQLNINKLTDRKNRNVLIGSGDKR